LSVSDPGSFGDWTHIAGAGNGALVFYNEANGQRSTGILQSDGSFDTVHLSDPGSFGHWTHIVGTGLGAFLFYDQPTGMWSTATLAADGIMERRKLGFLTQILNSASVD
jgi:hypothetical protein